MPTLSLNRLAQLLEPFYPALEQPLLEQLSTYLDLLVKWNARTNLSAIREPEEMVRRHFGESLFGATHLPEVTSLLDLGSGAGFPGLPIALARPKIAVTLAESQNKKATFLREVVRTLGISVEVWADRVETMPADRLFEAVTLRAVDNPTLAIQLARARLAQGGAILWFRSNPANEGAESPDGPQIHPIPGSNRALVELLR